MNIPAAAPVSQISEEVRAALCAELDLVVLEFHELLARHQITPVLTDEDFLALFEALLEVVKKLMLPPAS